MANMNNGLCKVATLPEIAKDLDILLEQLHLEMQKNNPDKDLMEKLVWRCKHKTVAVRGLINYNKGEI